MLNSLFGMHHDQAQTLMSANYFQEEEKTLDLSIQFVVNHGT